MEENNEVLEQEAEVTEEDLAAFDENFDSDDDGFDLSDESDEQQPEEDEADEEEDGSESETEEQGEETEEGNQLFEINYLGKKEQLTLKQMTELAQKGRDYDHVRQERDALKSETGRQTAFLKKLADKAGVSVEDQIDLTEAMWLMDEEAEKGNKISETEALLRIQKQRKEEGKAQEEESDEKIAKKLEPTIARFLEVYPDVKYEDIPQEVWAQVKKTGGELLPAYQAWQIRNLKAENAKQKQEEQNTKNEKRSAGSRKSAGANRQRDDFDEGWDSL